MLQDFMKRRNPKTKRKKNPNYSEAEAFIPRRTSSVLFTFHGDRPRLPVSLKRVHSVVTSRSLDT